MGTDSGVTPHGQNLRELPLMVECGMSPAEALVATTRTAAELLGHRRPRPARSSPARAPTSSCSTATPLDLDDLADRVRRVYQDGELVSDRGSSPDA